MQSEPQDQYLGLPLGRFLSLLAGPDPAPSGGGAAALAVALGAALCAMTARLSARHLGAAETTALTTDTERIAAAAASLIQADADSYSRVIEARRRLRGGGAPRPAVDERQRPASEGDRPLGDDVGAALSAASAVPVEIAELAVPTARAAARLAEAGNPSLRGDAITGALLAAAGARAAAALVAINLAGEPGDSRLAHAARLADEASSLAASATPGNPAFPPGR
jgi:methenyltetrahydrofolate cyclohydrolase